MQIFDPSGEYVVTQRRLPHWSQPGAVTFLTWRTWDSMPEAVVQNWVIERQSWLRQQGIDPNNSDWWSRLQRLKPELLRDFQTRFSERWNSDLDRCHGSCVLLRPDLAKEVAASLQHFDGDRYDLTDFVVMPNHVHVLSAFLDEGAMLKQCESWKRFTATRINKILGREGRFWQQDGFDHLVRSQEQFDYLRRYMAENPLRAGLRAGEFLHVSKQL